MRESNARRFSDAFLPFSFSFFVASGSLPRIMIFDVFDLKEGSEPILIRERK